jgi:hypothetical protein
MRRKMNVKTAEAATDRQTINSLGVRRRNCAAAIKRSVNFSLTQIKFILLLIIQNTQRGYLT